MKEIKLTRGLVALVDDEVFEELNQFKWCAIKSPRGKFYAVRNAYLGGGRSKTILMHRVILNAPAGLQVDHIDGESLDNHRANLRLATDQQNKQNQERPHRNNKLGVKGVCWCADRKKYQSSIRHNGKLIHLGRFESLADADKAYREAETKYFGEFARGVMN